ncbi:MAG TPA: hypothetical protein VL401_02690 [Alphaproteobacteria bacterium]|jgi:hypothetical protein|nr:hypothetical protein [Alphaproteobacteria bacterium]
MRFKPAQRRMIRAKKHERKQSFGFVFKMLLPLVLVIGIFTFVKTTTKFWNNTDKFAFTNIESSGNVDVIVLDPKLGEITTITIPAETEVDVARNYGTLRIKNVSKLSQNEKLDGKLVPETVTQNFLFPVTLWSDASLKDIFKFVFSPGKTNIPFGDRLMAGLFIMKIKDIDKTEIDMGKSQFLHKEKLNDGQIGYKLVGKISERLGIYFSDNEMASENLRVYIVDATNQAGVASNVGEIVEVLGGKIVSIDRKQEPQNSDCEVLGSNKNINKKIANLLSCSVINDKTDFDLEIRLGTKFASRF